MLTQAAASPTEELVLDAAREAILAVGWRRTTLTDIARRAGVSRMTVYRLWPDTQSLLADLMTREWVAMEQRVLAEAGDRPQTPEGIARLVVASVQALRSEPLFQRIVELDPELLLPYVLERTGRSQDHTIAALTALLAAGIGEGSVRAGDPAHLARALVLAAHGFVFSAQTMAGGDITVADLDTMLEHQIRSALTP